METIEIHNEKYSLHDVVRIVNPKQQKLYIKHNAYPVDMYVSKDLYSDDEILVMLFNKEETRELYVKWTNHELA